MAEYSREDHSEVHTSTTVLDLLEASDSGRLEAVPLTLEATALHERGVCRHLPMLWQARPEKRRVAL